MMQGKRNGKGNKRHEIVGSQAIVYALTCQMAQTSNDVVCGTLLVENLVAQVLFDPRATH